MICNDNQQNPRSVSF